MASPVRLVKWVFWRILRPAYEVGFWHYARLHRSKVRDTVFIGVTGSAGKTTTKDLTAAVLATRLRAPRGTGIRQLRARRRRERPLRPARRPVRVVEVGANDGPGSLDKPLALLRPRIGVVISVSTDHYTAFGSVEAIAAEKGKLVRALPPDGVAILNADDPRVLAMREGMPAPSVPSACRPGRTFAPRRCRGPGRTGCPSPSCTPASEFPCAPSSAGPTGFRRPRRRRGRARARHSPLRCRQGHRRGRALQGPDEPGGARGWGDLHSRRSQSFARHDSAGAGISPERAGGTEDPCPGHHLRPPRQ